MCTIAGYTGKERAVPKLLEMARKQEYFDSGYMTGIATVHEGKLYCAKVSGNIDTLLKETDCLNFPGTCGIIHSRPSDGPTVEYAHPHLDKSEKLAVVINGTRTATATKEHIENQNALMQSFFDRGINIRSMCDAKSDLHLKNGKAYHTSDFYALYAGELIDSGMSITDATYKALNDFPKDIVSVLLHVSEPDTLTIGRITRPMNIALTKDSAYIASCAIAFPEDVDFINITPVPVTSIVSVRPGTFTLHREGFENVKVQPLDLTIYKKGYELYEKYLTGKKDDPRPFDERIWQNEWKSIWKEPYIECKYAVEGGFLKPEAQLMYELLTAFYREKRLGIGFCRFNGRRYNGFYLDPK